MESQWTIYAKSGLQHVDATGQAWDYSCDAEQAGPIMLHKLLNKRIRAVTRSKKTFTFTFEDGSRLAIKSELGPYESGHINSPHSSDATIVF